MSVSRSRHPSESVPDFARLQGTLMLTEHARPWASPLRRGERVSSLQTTAQHTRTGFKSDPARDPSPCARDTSRSRREARMFGTAIIPVAVLVSLLGAQQAFAQCRVAGELRTADGAPIAGATVRVESPGLKAPVTGITDASGHYDIEHVKPGIYVQVTAFQQNGRLLAR